MINPEPQPLVMQAFFKTIYPKTLPKLTLYDTQKRAMDYFNFFSVQSPNLTRIAGLANRKLAELFELAKVETCGYLH